MPLDDVQLSPFSLLCVSHSLSLCVSLSFFILSSFYSLSIHETTIQWQGGESRTQEGTFDFCHLSSSSFSSFSFTSPPSFISMLCNHPPPPSAFFHLSFTFLSPSSSSLRHPLNISYQMFEFMSIFMTEKKCDYQTTQRRESREREN